MINEIKKDAQARMQKSLSLCPTRLDRFVPARLTRAFWAA